MLATATVVTPRPGTISSWSSKATDIARRCGLDGVVRIERGVAWSIAHIGDDGGDVAGALCDSGLLHDRMTQRACPPGTFLSGTSESDAGVEAVFLAGTPPH